MGYILDWRHNNRYHCAHAGTYHLAAGVAERVAPVVERLQQSPYPRPINGHRQISEAVEKAIAAQFPLKAGRPSLVTEANKSWGYSGLIPRSSFKNYRVRPGSNVLETLKIIRDRDPDASKATMNFLLLMAQGYNATVHRGFDAEGKPREDARGQQYIQQFDAMVGQEYGGGMDNLIDVFNLSLITHGAVAVELEISPDLRSIIDVHPVDPSRVQMKRNEAESNRLMRGIIVGREVPGADKDGFLELSPRQFRYIPLHPDVDSPYGRSPFLSAIASVFFKIELLEDLKAVVHNQGYPRLDIEVIQEAVYNNMPATYKEPGNEAQAIAFVTAFITELKAQYSELKPDDTFIHWDNIKVNATEGAGGGSFDFTGLSEVLDTQITAGLKQLPILLGRNEGATTTHATVQWKVFALQIEAMQRRIKRLIEWVHTTALNVGGLQAESSVEFESQPVSDRFIEAQALNFEIDAWVKMVAQGWATDDEASQALLQHPAAGEKQPTPESSAPVENPPEEAATETTEDGQEEGE